MTIELSVIETQITVSTVGTLQVVEVLEVPIPITISGTGTGLSDAPANGSIYGRKDGAWIVVSMAETDPVFLASQAFNITAQDITNLDNLSGTNTGDQDLSGFLTDAPSNGNTYGRRNGSWTTVTVTETDPVFLASVAAGIDGGDISNWDSKQAGDATLTSIAALGTAADRMIYTTAVDTWAEASLSAFARTMLDDANAAALLATIGAQVALGYTPVNEAGDTMSGDLRGTDFVATRAGTITRDGNGYISSVAKAGGRTITITRDGNGYIASAADGTNTWTLARDGNGNIASWAVT